MPRQGECSAESHSSLERFETHICCQLGKENACFIMSMCKWCEHMSSIVTDCILQVLQTDRVYSHVVHTLHVLVFGHRFSSSFEYL